VPQRPGGRLAAASLPITSRDGRALDGLTGLAGRDAVLDDATMALRTRPGHIAILYLDIEGLRGINDAMGIAAGDSVVAAFAQRLSGMIRHDDTAARLGGDEFALVCSGLTDDFEAERLAKRVATEVERAYEVDGRSLPLRVSIGMAVGSRGTCTADELLRDASAAMYAAKAQSGGVIVFSEELKRTSAERFEMEAAIHQALEQEQFTLHYQPLVSLPGMRVIGTEALLRWRSGDRWIPPGEFIPVAEQSGLIVTIGHWVMSAAANQLRQWHAEGHDLSMSLNLSAKQLADAALPYEVSQLIETCSIHAGALTLEVTETTVMQHLEVAIPVMRILRDLGVRLAIDDFGTGHASLTQLKNIPADELKLDRTFIIDLADDKRERALVRAAIEMAHALELEVVAEGVETKDQLDILLELGCDTVQGYFLARPAPADQVRLVESASA
jgi:diguanylate cyclase (GGDEF)-like protein